MKRQRQTELPRFIVGALATAGASTASGATVQITFANNVVSSLTGFANFTGDLTGDGAMELKGFVDVNGVTQGVHVLRYPAGALVGRAFSMMTSSSGSSYRTFQAGVGNNGVGNLTLSTMRRTTGLLFTDARINGGLPTNGWVDVTASASSKTGSGQSVRINRLIFDDASTTAPGGVAYTDSAYPEWEVSAVPEPGSNLALLALGAGGILTRRRQKRAA